MRTKKVVRVCIIAAALLLVGASATMNARYGYFLGQDIVSRWTWVIASIASDVCKALAPLILVVAISNREWFKAGATILLIGVTVLYSAVAAIGFAANSRSVLTSVNRGQMDRYDQARLDAQQATTEIKRITSHRRWQSTAGCSDATMRKSRLFCAVNAELYAQARTELERAKEALARGKPATTDAQAAAIARFLGRSVSEVQVWVAWLAAALVEIGSLVGLLVSSTPKRRRKVVIAEPPARLDVSDALDWLVGNGQLVISNRQLGTQWGVSHATAGRWVKDFEENGHVQIEYDGKKRRIIAT